MSTHQQTFGNRYAVIERVGVGGMAEVYRARDELLDREVAVKVLSERLARDRSFVDRFRREAQSAANLNHPNIVSLYDFGSDDNNYYIVMEFIDGRSLADIVKEEGPLLPERAAEIAADVAKALERAHAGGLVHRDIKSHNIMITKSGQTKVTDFGIARALTPEGEQTMTQTGMVIGTAAYLSPEQAQGSRIDERSDIYSLGVVLYEMLTGATPFSGETPLAVAYKHVREDPAVPSTVNSDVPSALDAVVMKMLAKNPDNRYSSAAELQADLTRFLSGQKVQAGPVMADETMMMAGSGTEVLRETDYYPEGERRRAGLYVVVALLLLGLFGLLAWLVADNLLGGEPVEVPELVGMHVDEARDELEELGLDAEVDRRPSKKPVDEVFDQDPEAGETVEEGDAVTLLVSAGARQTTVPDLTGLTEEEAIEALELAKLELGDVTSEPNEEFDEGEIFDQDPAPDEEADRGSEVDIFVSGGAETVTVPFVEGQSQEDAEAEIEAAGLVVQVVTAPSSEVEEGFVISQDPDGGSEAQEGDTVVIEVSEGAEENEMPNVEGMDDDDAEALLEAEPYELDVERVEQACENAEPPGTVCDQDPAPGTPVSPGDDATIFVQAGDSALPDRILIVLLSLGALLA